MSEKKESWWWRIIPSLLTLIGILVGIWQFNKEQEIRDQNEFKRNIWTRRVEAYEKVGNATASVVTSTNDSARFEKAIKDFHHLYWGVMPLVQDDDVEKAMIKFNAEIRYFQRKESTPDDLRKRGYQLMRACKSSIKTSWENLTNGQ